ncbi:uncharacterized protein IWZ02DRAFT_102087 [Phyllosticta citriasiana]|uniref:Uncharacterized protein n=1 Tax=Phyllosticta citriasiana TaxID=595635 RepID=A0ABR1KE93_9PEZI
MGSAARLLVRISKRFRTRCRLLALASLTVVSVFRARHHRKSPWAGGVGESPTICQLEYDGPLRTLTINASGKTWGRVGKGFRTHLCCDLADQAPRHAGRCSYTRGGE